MNPESLARTLQEFLADAREAAILEDGARMFDLADSKYSISTQHGKCLLHMWSAERNTVRRVVDAEIKNGVLRLAVLRFGQSRPSKLEICRDRDRRTPTAKRAARSGYERLLQRVLQRSFAEFTVDRLSSAMDLERSFGPVYARGMLRRGNSSVAVLGVNAQEPPASVDAGLTFGILWLDLCRERGQGLVEGLKLFVPVGTSAIVRARMACLKREAAKWQLYELDEGSEALEEVDCSDRGNIATRLVHCANQGAARERFAKSVALVQALVTDVEVAVVSPAEISFRICGLEFARARLGAGDGFRHCEEIVFGLGGAEAVLSEHNAEEFASLAQRLAARRRADTRAHADPLWRACPERWLECIVVRDVNALDERLDPAYVYSQVPAFAASDRAMIDVLAATRDGRLTVVELKADEDIHLPLQGLDYWARVSFHHARGEFKQFGYFPERELAPEPPRLVLVAPALHVHPATDTLLRYISPEIDCELAAIDERWREGVRVIFRKRAERHFAADQRG